MTQKRSCSVRAKQTKNESVAMNEDVFAKIRHFQSCYQAYNHVTMKIVLHDTKSCLRNNFSTNKQRNKQNMDFIVEN